MPLYPPLYTNPPPPLPDIDVSNPDAHRAAFHHTDYDSTLPLIRARFPNIDPVYIAKIYRGTIHPEGLIWLDVDRQDASPPNFSDLAYLLYCFEVYGQILCILTDPHGGAKEVEMQRALTDYRLRLLKLSKVASFESLREWNRAYLEVMIAEGQDRVEGWRERREGLGALLKRKEVPTAGATGAGGHCGTHGTS